MHVEKSAVFLFLLTVPFLEQMFYNANTEKITSEGGRYMTTKDKLIRSIDRILAGMDEARLRIVYQFVLHLSK